jgi:hypothetical protein
MALTEMMGEAGDLIGSWIAEAMNRGDYETAERLIRDASRRYDGMSVPGAAEQAGGTAFDGVGLDKESMDARRAALRKFQQIGMEGGMDAESEAALAQARFQSAQHEAGQRGALMQRAQERGQGSGAMNAAAQLISQQGASQNLAMQGVQAAGDARRRALQALSQSENIGRGLTEDEYRRSADRAQAIDNINRFNTGLRADAQNRRFSQQMQLADAQAQGKMAEAGIYENRAARRKENTRKGGRAAGASVGAVGDAYMGGF